jgi:lactobin A/cerein 7B family class IIb bacteriocin
MNTTFDTFETTDETGIRNLTQEELEAIQGGWLLNALGAVVGGISSGAGAYISSGGNWGATAIAAAGGAAAGFVLPWNSVRSAATSVGRSLISGTVAGGLTAATQGPSTAPPQQ